MTEKQHSGVVTLVSNRPAGKGRFSKPLRYGGEPRHQPRLPEHIETLMAECDAADAASRQAHERLMTALIAERDALDEAIAQLECEQET